MLRAATTIYNRYHRWSLRGIWQGMLAAVVEATPGGMHLIDSTTAKAHRSAAGGKGGRRPGHRPLTWRPRHQIHLVTDGLGRILTLPAYAGSAGRCAACPCPVGRASTTRLLPGRYSLRQRRAPQLAAGPRNRAGNPQQSHPQTCPPVQSCLLQAAQHHRTSHRPAEGLASVHIRYDKLARNFASAVAIAALIQGWC